MKLTFLGADRTTTGSKYLLQVNGSRVLLECGMFQGRRAKTIEYNTKLPFDPTRVNAMLLSHAHIDHSGIIPILCRDGFPGKIFCTDATADLCNIMLLDTAHIQEQDAVFLNKKNVRKGLPFVEPLYTQADAQASMKQFQPVRYQQPTPIVDGVTATWIDAGHILGSAHVVLDLEEGGRKVRFAFSGDIGRGHSDILRDPEHPQGVDILMMESTYGNREHEPMDNVNDRVCAIVQRTLERRGKIIIPSFAVGRTQQLLYTFHKLIEQKRIPPLPTFVDSPLATSATEVFRRHTECFNDKFRAELNDPENPFHMTNVTFTASVQESIAINDMKEPCIIISASGMAEAGRILHHLKNNIGDARNTILIVGWCAQHTLGARLASGDKLVNIYGEPHKVCAQVETINAFSGHADHTELLAWAKNVSGPLKNIFVVHGEEQASMMFAADLRALYPKSDICVPTFNDSVEL
jgi:metallo-beta-lactamase family protein